MSALFLDDGYTCAQVIPAAPGFHPEAEVTYRPALARVRHGYAAAAKSGDAEKIEAFEAGLCVKHVVTLNGKPLDAAQAGRLHPLVRSQLVDLILSFAPGAVAPEADVPNS